MKGILLSAGQSSRLYPVTIPFGKGLLPVFDKPMVYYPLSTLMLTGIRDILMITTPRDRPLYESLLHDGTQWGIVIQYAEQQSSRGIADAFIVGESFIGDNSVCLILGDNIFCGRGLKAALEHFTFGVQGAKIFAVYEKDPRKFGVVEFDKAGRAISLQEKPLFPKSNYIVPGLYFYDNHVVEIAKQLKPSARGEIEITDVNKKYLEQSKLSVDTLDSEISWIDAGTPESLLRASNEIRAYELANGVKVGCPEEAAFLKGYITCEQLEKLVKPLVKTAYGQYLMKLKKA